MGELGYGAGFVEWFAAEARRTWGETISSPFPNKRLLTIKQPIGVAGMVTPVSSLHLREDIFVLIYVTLKFIKHMKNTSRSVPFINNGKQGKKLQVNESR